MPTKPQILIIVARFNELVTRSLFEGAKSHLEEQLGPYCFEAIWVPGSFEIPALVAKALEAKSYDAVITLGAVIKGETPHFDYVAGPVASALMQISVSQKTPVIFGILTTETVEQALNRAGLKHGNKGTEAAQAAIEMMRHFRRWDS